MKNVLIVESPTKAKTIGKYLDKNFTIIPSFGHIRELPSKKNSVEPDNNFKMHYRVSPDSIKHVKEIIKAVKNADNLYLATDPDREGESISWHIVDELRSQNQINEKTRVYRISFNEITKQAIQNAIQNPKDINLNLVYAQQTRTALDYLVGFSISPILWTKLPGSRSAGRVQSVALRMICERENEIENFKKEEYWSISGNFLIEKNQEIFANLISYNGEKIEKLTIKNAEDAQKIVSELKKLDFKIKNISKKQSRRNPYPPFITSTLQQEASNSLNISPKKTMMIAQKLYEGIEIGGANVGLITYMRTDGVYISQDFIKSMRDFIHNSYGEKYLSEKPRIYKNKVKNAQEAHEAIRPTDITKTPESIRQYLDPLQFKLYNIIWRRTLASQMHEALFDQTSVLIEDLEKKSEFKCSGSIMAFDGFYKIYEYEEKDILIPNINLNDSCKLKDVDSKQHFTQPPPRFTEASIIKTLEEFGIGRPSTYASIISILQDRKYIVVEKKKLIPETRGRIVSAFLVLFFTKYVEYGFTANLEKLLDEISNGVNSSLKILNDFWNEFSTTTQNTKDQDRQLIVSAIESFMKNNIFPKDENGSPMEYCSKCKTGKIQLKFSKFGAFLGCSNYPTCNFTKSIDSANKQQAIEETSEKYPKILGEYQGTNISIRKGPYGPYLQHDSMNEKTPPKRISLSQYTDNIDLDYAIKLISLPIVIAKINRKNVTLDKKKYGFFIKYDNKNFSLKNIETSPFQLTTEEIKKIIEDKKTTTKKRQKRDKK